MNLKAQITVKILLADSPSCSANTCWDTLNKIHCLLLRCQGKKIRRSYEYTPGQTVKPSQVGLVPHVTPSMGTAPLHNHGDKLITFCLTGHTLGQGTDIYRCGRLQGIVVHKPSFVQCNETSWVEINYVFLSGKVYCCSVSMETVSSCFLWADDSDRTYYFLIA